MALEYLYKQHPGRKNFFLKLPHRLDRTTGGIMIFAKTPQALKNLNAQFANRVIKKKYLTWVNGHIQPASGTLSQWIGRNEDGKKAVVWDSEKKDLKHCILHYTTLKQNQHHSLLEIELHTGRYHQIRAQMAFAGNPISGDKLYGATDQSSNVCLWSVEITALHPKSNAAMVFKMNTDFIFTRFA